MFNLFKKIIDNLRKFILEKFSTTKLSITSPKKTIHFINDPTTPYLEETVLFPNKPFLNITVNSIKDGGNPVGTIAWQAENAYISLANCLNNLQKYFPKTVKRWAATTNLVVYPRAGNDANAYYDRSTLKFFYFNSQISNKVIYTIESSDIVIHELGHAVLDSIRPDFWNAAAFEVGAFHESFGDMTAIISLLQYDLALNKLLEKTNGNLRQNNFASGLAEEFGLALKIGNSLRNAFNNVNYVNPNKLPQNGLTKEVHSFSVVWTGAFYDIFVSIFEKLGKTKNALITARDAVTLLLFETIKKVPVTVNFFNSMAKCMIDVDKNLNKSLYKNILLDVFGKRNILSKSDVAVLKNSIKILEEEKENILYKNTKEAFIVPNVKSFVLNNKKIKVQLVCDSYCSEDKNKFNALATFHNENESIKEAQSFVDYLFEKDLIGNKENHTWFIDSLNDDQLTRSKMQCDCLGFRNNCTIEGQPEYKKCWKPESNSGCCPYGCPTTPKVEVKTYKSCAIRYSNCSNNVTSSNCNKTLN
jgi:hypothetical protein